MANKIFDRETLLDLTVNAVPLFIIAFFIVAFALFPAFGVEPLGTALQFGLLVVPFVFLAVLTYVSGKAIAGDEKRSSEVLLPGQATTSDGVTVEEYEKQTEQAEAEAAAESDPELANDDDE